MLEREPKKNGINMIANSDLYSVRIKVKMPP
jgi:hypothetical protein